MSDEHEHERHHMEVHSVVVHGGVEDLVQTLAERLHEITGGAVMVLVIDPDHDSGACGLAVHTDDTPALLHRVRQSADTLEHEYLARFN